MKDLIDIEGVRDNQLVGYGIVVGLAGKGDSQQTIFSNQSLTNILERMGVAVSPTAIRVKNTAAVMVTATLPPFAQPGTRIDSTIAAIGDASTLQGGILILTSLRGADGQVYAIAQGPVVTGGFIAGRGGASQSVNHPNRGARAQQRHGGARRAIGGAEDRGSPAACASRISQPRRASPKPSTSVSPMRTRITPGLVSVPIPADFATRSAEFIAELESLIGGARPRRPRDHQRTDGNDRVGQGCANLAGCHHARQPQRRSAEHSRSFAARLRCRKGTTQVVQQDKVAATEEKSRNVLLKQGATIEELVRALAAIGSTPRDVIAILQSLQERGGARSGNRGDLMSQISMASMAHADPQILAEGAVKKTDSPEKIKDAAQQFEGLLLSQILSTVHEDGGWLGSGSDSSSGAATSFAEQQLAGMIAQKGGLGLSGMISAGITTAERCSSCGDG